MALCSELSLVNGNDEEGHATVLRCKRWSCDLCNPWNHRRVKRLAREGVPNVFLTLTVNPAKFATPDEAARGLKRAWVNLRRAMERDYGVKQPPFIAIFETTKKGWPHLHILMRCRFIPQQWYSTTMERLLGSPIVDVRFITEKGRVAAYVAKYVSKAPDAFEACKRWWRSHDYSIEQEEYEPFNRYGPFTSEIKRSIDEIAKRKAQAGWLIEEESPEYVRWRWPQLTMAQLREGIAENMRRLTEQGYFASQSAGH